MADMRQQFLDAIKADPYDLKTRKIFADWLDEFGDEKDADLAAEQRAWTREKQDAIVWLTEYAQYLDMSYEELIQEVVRIAWKRITGQALAGSQAREATA